MKASDVLKLLRITRPTLTKYVKEELIKVEKLPNGRYEYDSESVYSFLNKDVKRKTYIYARVSNSKQRSDLDNQIKLLKQFCFANGYTISGIFSDIANGINFEKRNDFFKMLNDIINNKVERIIITHKDRLSRTNFDLLYYLFKQYNCEIIVMSEIGSEKLDSQEIFEEIVNLLHCYSIKLCDKRKIQKIKEVITDGRNR